MGMDIGQFIKTRRLELKFSQRQVALNSELSNATISRIESGTVLPDAATLSKIAKALKLNPSLLFKISGYIGEPTDIQKYDSEIKPESRKKASKTPASFGTRLKGLRESAGYSREEFCEATGYSPALVESWEAGAESPGDSVIQDIAGFLGVTASYLMGKSDIMVPGPRRRSTPSKKDNVLREAETGDIHEVLKELSRAVENAQKVLAAYSKEDEKDN